MLQKFPVYAYIPAQNVTRAREFYEGKLGFTSQAFWEVDDLEREVAELKARGVMALIQGARR